jgi:hypothetical protein
MLTSLRVSQSGKYILAGTVAGAVIVRRLDLRETYLRAWDQGHELVVSGPPMAGDELGSQTLTDLNNDLSGGYVWIHHLHHSTGGKVFTDATTFDDAFLITAGQEGGLFAFRNGIEQVEQDHTNEASTETTVEDDGVPVEDILDATAYSIQDQKLKAEKDRELAEAEKKKQV